MILTLTSTAFAHGSLIPSKYTCEGADISPPLKWVGVPSGCKSLVLIVDDPDAPDPKAPNMTWVHWVLYDLPPNAGHLPEDAGAGQLPLGTKIGTNDWRRHAYGGPCPPIGRHRYFFKLYALDTSLDSFEPLSKADIEKGMMGHILAEAVLMGTYQKSPKHRSK